MGGGLDAGPHAGVEVGLSLSSPIDRPDKVEVTSNLGDTAAVFGASHNIHKVLLHMSCAGLPNHPKAVSHRR